VSLKRYENDLFFLLLFLNPSLLVPLALLVVSILIFLTPYGGNLIFEPLFLRYFPPSEAHSLTEMFSIGLPLANWGAVVGVLARRESHQTKKKIMMAIAVVLVVAGTILIMIPLSYLIKYDLQVIQRGE